MALSADGNDASVLRTMLPLLIPENSAVGEPAITLLFTDDDSDSVYTFTLLAGSGVGWNNTNVAYGNKSVIGSAFGLADGVSAVLVPLTLLNYEAQSSFTLLITIRDFNVKQPAILFTNYSVPVRIVDRNDPPVLLIPPTGYHVTENSVVGTVVLTLACLDEDVNDTGTVTDPCFVVCSIQFSTRHTYWHFLWNMLAHWQLYSRPCPNPWSCFAWKVPQAGSP